MTELKRYRDDLDAVRQAHARELSERDRREVELRAECEEKTRRAWDMVRERANSFEQYIDYHSGLERQLRAELLAAKGSAHDTQDRLEAAESELVALRQQVREVTEWRPMETCPHGVHVRVRIKPELVVGMPAEAIMTFFAGGPKETRFVGWLPIAALPPLPKEMEQ
jgi:hypothetical protein